MTDPDPELERPAPAPGLETAEMEAEPAPPSRTLVRSLAVLTALFFLATVTMSIVAAKVAGERDEDRNGRQEVEQVASRLAQRLLTYDYQHLDRTKAGVLALATNPFRKDYDDHFGDLETLLTRIKGTSTAVIKEVFVSDLEDDTASVLVVVDVTVSSVSGTRPGTDSYVRLDLTKVAGVWRVSQVTNLNFGAAPVGSTPSTTTTAPPK